MTPESAANAWRLVRLESRRLFCSAAGGDALDDSLLELEDRLLQGLDPLQDLLVALEQLLVLLFLDVGRRGRVLERPPISMCRPVPGEQDERCRIGRLRREREVQEDERVRIEVEEEIHVARDPDEDDHALDRD